MGMRPYQVPSCNLPSRAFNNHMPRYFFHIRHPDNALVPDEEGAEFKDYETARSEAVASIQDIAFDALRSGERIAGLAIEIADGTGKPLGNVQARDIFG